MNIRYRPKSIGPACILSCCIPFNSEVDRKQHLLLRQTPHPCTVPAPYLRQHAVLAAFLTLHTDVRYLTCLLLCLFNKSFALSVFQLLPTSHVYCLTNTLHTLAKHTTHSSPLFRFCSSNVGAPTSSARMELGEKFYHYSPWP